MDPKALFNEYLDLLVKEMMNDQRTVSFEKFWKPKKTFWERKLSLVRSSLLYRCESPESPAASNGSKKKKKKKKQIEFESSSESIQTSSEEETASSFKANREKLTGSNLGKLRVSHKAVDNEGVIVLRREKVQEIEEILNITSFAAQALLNHFNWDKERLLEVYIENPEATCAKSGLPYPPPARGEVSEDIKEEDEPEEYECPVCYMESNEWTKSPHCGHKFCDGCWQYNLEMQINEGHTLDIHCMHNGCNTLISDDIIKKIVDKHVYEKYVKFLSQSFVDTNKGLKWCPARNCGKVVIEKIYEGGHPVGKCSCGKIFCFQCMEDAHTPLSCDDNIKWKKLSDESLINNKWLYENTKPCPGCKTPIEKNDGCFMMTCSNCRYAFCWLCLQNWSTHGNHFKCSKYGDTTVTNKPKHHDDQEPKFEDVENFYFVRYQEYTRALKLEDEHWKTTEQTIRHVKENNASVDPTFLLEAHKQLQKCRRILTFTFAYLAMNEDILIKAFHEPMEMIVENLSQKTEKIRDFEQLDRVAIKKLTSLANKSLENFLEEESVVKLFKP